MKRCTNTNTAPWQPFSYSVVRGVHEGKQLDGACVAAIDAWGVRERGRCLEVVVLLNDRRMALYSFARGAPIIAHVVSDAYGR
jgi:hypothetical protein